MQRLIKFLHTIGAIGLMGSMMALLVLLSFLPEPASLPEYARMRSAMGGIATWIFLPSLALTLIAGLLALAANRAYQDAGWALVKLATGVLLFEFGFMAVQGPMQQEAALSAQALAQTIDPAALGTTLDAERASLWVLLGVAIVNVVLGVWRPRIGRLWPSS
jgi:uncharacterized membrane protein